jgi:hypothetical protein
MSRTTQHTAIVQHNPDGSKTIRLGAPLQSSSSQGTLGPGATCSSNSQCQNGACGRPHPKATSLMCCPSGKYVNYWGYDYCTGMPNGTACFENQVCANGLCQKNTGTNTGTCATANTLPKGATCNQNAQCQSNSCTIVRGNYLGVCQ